jgi:hypothetical protein
MNRHQRYPSQKDLQWDMIRRSIEKRGVLWNIAAMVDGSIGYHSPKDAKALLEDALKGVRKDFCERCYCCYEKDLFGMICADIDYFRRREQARPETAARIVGRMEKVAQLLPMQQSTFGLMYPSMGV